MDYYGARNKVLYAWHNVPFPAVIGHLAGTTAKTLAYTFRPNRVWTRLRGVLAGCVLAANGRARREPVKMAAYRLSQELKRQGVMPVEEISSRLPEASLSLASGFHEHSIAAKV